MKQMESACRIPLHSPELVTREKIGKAKKSMLEKHDRVIPTVFIIAIIVTAIRAKHCPQYMK